MWGSLAWAILLWRQASAQSDALAIVRTPADLKTALADGTAHVEIQQHLDLRGESLSAQATARFNIPPLYQPLGTFESLRGNCSESPPQDLSVTRDLKPGQCVVAVNELLLRLSPAGNQSVWIDNLYFFADAAEEVRHFHMDADFHRAWFTNIVSEGTQQNSSAMLLAGDQAQYYVGDSAILNHRQLVPGIFVGRASTTLRLRRVTFAGNAGTTPQSAATFAFELAFSAVEECNFDDQVLPDVAAGNATAGVDDVEAYRTIALFGGRIVPLAQLPSNLTFLTEDDADLKAIQERSLAGRTPLGQPADTPETAPAKAPVIAPVVDGPGEDIAERNGIGAPPIANPNDDDNEDGSNTSAIAGGIAGAVVALVAIALLAWWLVRRSQRKSAAGSPGGKGATDVGATAAGPPLPGAVPPMHVGGINETFSSMPTGTQASYGPGSYLHMQSGGPQSPYGTPSWGPSGQPSYSIWGNTTASGGSGPPQALFSSPQPVAQQQSGWLHAPPPPGSRPATIYQLPSTAGSGSGGAVAGMLATQRPAPALAEVMSTEAQREQLERSLYSMAAAQPQELFMGRYLLMQERRGGGQATVQFARGGDGGFFQYAIKFFNRVQDFAIEEAMYRKQAIKPVLPDLFAGAANGDGGVRARSGYVFPPFLIMERGMTLADWVQQRRDALAVLSMFKDCAALLATLHAAGHVHRDLKPDNVLLMLQTQAWRLIDFGIAAPLGAALYDLLFSCAVLSPDTGKETPPQCTLGYAAPEVVVAFDEKRAVAAAPAQDVWALGIMVFEAFTRKPGVDPFGGIDGCKALARGEKEYPWETQDQGKEFGGSRARQLVESCLARDPAARPTAAELIDAISLISNRTDMLE